MLKMSYSLKLIEGEGYILTVPKDFEFKCRVCRKPIAFGMFCNTSKKLFCKECNLKHDDRLCLGGIKEMRFPDGHTHFNIIEIKKED